ncbi:hypothetical protein [Mesorhizobium sp. M7A.F.Ca.US.008.03.1.1]|uniref:hypothetical protein n=1 Tax=Mesorhizobium sp. M7A.F.Ca.US.008.03.1.1 TaxID=2496742 RepID=UPI000FC9FF52|nr:hypothetical protein [Mesorhizobium sp. M7A.F.Ca.US.008.03.1.1]RUW60172.1 hypothetical protein EOA16_18960 [Mesorhizobium sp. M7A.F.Ca.US.008.03.1.1]
MKNLCTSGFHWILQESVNAVDCRNNLLTNNGLVCSVLLIGGYAMRGDDGASWPRAFAKMRACALVSQRNTSFFKPMDHCSKMQRTF